MAAPLGVWGIDIGQCALKAIRLELIDNEITATAFDYVEHPKILSQPDADPDQLTREALDKFLSRNSLKGDLVAISVPGQSGLARFVKLPPVEEKKIGDIVKFEAKQQIPFPLEEVVWDFQKIGAGEVADGFALETEIGLFAMKRDMIGRHLAHFQDVGAEVDIVQMSPLALCNYVSHDVLGADKPADDDTPPGKRRCVVALDIGADSSNLIVTDGDKVIWQRPIPLGGNHLTRALSKELKLTFAKAEHLKRNAAKSPPELKSILAALKPVLTDFVGEVQRSLGYFANTHREAHVAFMVGLGNAFRLPGLLKYLSEKLQIDVRKPSKINKLHGDEVIHAPVFTENILTYAVAYGLAIQGLKVSKLQTNLLPPEIRQERMIRSKKPWAVAAAAAIMAGVGILTAGYAYSHGAVTAKPIAEQITRADDVLKRMAAQNGDADAKSKKNQETASDVKSIIAGRDEQLNWLRLNEYINRCLPRPDGANLTRDGSKPKPGGDKNEMEPNQIVYWRTQEATDAAAEFALRLMKKEGGDAPLDDFTRENLCMVDVEAIDTLFCPNLKAFFDNAASETERLGKKFDGMLKFDLDNPPKDGSSGDKDGQGWVIAIRGSTFQKKGRDFLVDSLVYNLAANCNRTFTAAPSEGGATPPPADTAPANASAQPEPIKDRVTHVFLYNCWTVTDPQPGSFKHIGTSVLRPLVIGAAAPPGAGGPPTDGLRGDAQGGQGGAGSSTREAWQPLAGFGSGSAQGGATGMPAPNRGLGGLGGGGARGDAAGDGPNASKAKPRYEFIVMFVWKEPTPSDALIKSAEGGQ